MNWSWIGVVRKGGSTNLVVALRGAERGEAIVQLSDLHSHGIQVFALGKSVIIDTRGSSLDLEVERLKERSKLRNGFQMAILGVDERIRS